MTFANRPVAVATSTPEPSGGGRIVGWRLLDRRANAEGDRSSGPLGSMFFLARRRSTAALPAGFRRATGPRASRSLQRVTAPWLPSPDQPDAPSQGTISKNRGERLRHSGLRSEALFDEPWQKRDVIAA